MDSLKIENFYFLAFLCFFKKIEKNHFLKKMDSLKNWKNSQKVKILKKSSFVFFYIFLFFKELKKIV